MILVMSVPRNLLGSIVLGFAFSVEEFRLVARSLRFFGTRSPSAFIIHPVNSYSAFRVSHKGGEYALVLDSDASSRDSISTIWWGASWAAISLYLPNRNAIALECLDGIRGSSGPEPSALFILHAAGRFGPGGVPAWHHSRFPRNRLGSRGGSR